MTLMFLCVVFSALGLASATLDPATAVKNIRSNVLSYRSSSNVCGSYPCCTIGSSESCPLSAMTGESTIVFPGGKSRCIFSDSTPYAFQVFKGSSSKLMVYFQGGGACWDRLSTEAGLCTTDVSPQLPIGIFDRERLANEFRDYTIVHAMYCSGDVWGGNVTRPYNDAKGVPVVQVGVENAQATLDWIQQQQKSGELASELSRLVVMGCSAGSIGAQLWSDRILNTLSWKEAAVVPDSYAAVFPPNTQGPLVREYGLCQWSGLPADLQKKCYEGDLTIQEVNIEFMKKSPLVPFAYIQSKTDIVQQSFYVSVGLTSGQPFTPITPSQFYADVNEIFASYNTLPNFLTYLVNGDQHCFTNLFNYYSVDCLGLFEETSSSVCPVMSEWGNQFPLHFGGIVESECDGNLMLAQDAATARLKPALRKGLNDNTYCSAEVIPKEFLEK